MVSVYTIIFNDTQLYIFINVFLIILIVNADYNLKQRQLTDLCNGDTFLCGHRTSWCCVQHYCFVFGRYWVKILARRPNILTEDFS